MCSKSILNKALLLVQDWEHVEEQRKLSFLTDELIPWLNSTKDPNPLTTQIAPPPTISTPTLPNANLKRKKGPTPSPANIFSSQRQKRANSSEVSAAEILLNLSQGEDLSSAENPDDLTDVEEEILGLFDIEELENSSEENQVLTV